MAQKLRAIIGLAEKKGLVLKTHIAVQTLHNSSSKGSGILFWPPLTTGTSTAHFHKYKQIHINIKYK